MLRHRAVSASSIASAASVIAASIASAASVSAAGVFDVYFSEKFVFAKKPGHWEHQLFYGKTGKTVNMVGKISSCLKYKNFKDSNLNRIPRHLSPGLGFIKKMQPYSKLN